MHRHKTIRGCAPDCDGVTERRAAGFRLPVAVLAAGATLFALCARRVPPDRPTIVAGPAQGSVNVNYEFAAVAVSPEGDSVAIRFDWGDGDTSDWSGYAASGEEVTIGHTWADTGKYLVKAQARTPAGAESDWSEPHPVSVIIFRLGTLKWRFATGGRVASSPAVADDGTVYIGSADRHLYAVNPDGTLKWRHRAGGGIEFSPAVADDGGIYFGAGDSCLYALDPDGTLRWRFETGAAILTPPAIAADGGVCFGAGDSCLYALDPDGTLRWRYRTGGAVHTSPAVAADGTVYVGSRDHHLHAVNPDGTLRWRYRIGHALWSSPAVAADGTVYFGGADSLLCALNPDGTLRWAYHEEMSSLRYSPAVGMDGTIYVSVGGPLSASFRAFTPDGSLKWRDHGSGIITGSPAVTADGTIYYGELDGIRALALNGTLRWQYRTDSATCPAVADDGTVYWGSGEYLYAVQGSGPLADSPWPKFRADSRNTGRARRP